MDIEARLLMEEAVLLMKLTLSTTWVMAVLMLSSLLGPPCCSINNLNMENM